MPLSNLIKQTKALCLIRLRLLLNNLLSKAGLSKIIGICLIVLVTIIATAAGASDFLTEIFKLPFANLIAEWAIGFLVLYGIFVVFTGDLVSGHTLNTGQMSSDFHYLSTLPIPPMILVLTKQFERLITDYFGILFLLPSLIGISCYRAYTLKAILAAIFLYFEISFTIGLLINLSNICLKRFFKPSTINNFYSIFGYISAILTLIPFLMVSNFNPSHVPKVLEKIVYLQENMEWLMLPIRWLAAPLLYSTPFCPEFLKITILWLVIVSILLFLFHIALKNNWFAYVHSNKASAKSIKGKKLLNGLIWKEWLMMKSDLNLLVNAILMPISIIAIEIYFLKRVFSFTSMYSIINFIFGSIIYFSLFGPINIIGYEGKSISLLESMPIAPAQIIKKKYLFWVFIALIIFIPSTIVTFRILYFDWIVTSEATLLTTLFTLAAVWITVCLSAIFARYDSKVLQQHSSFVGKMAAMSLMSILLPIKNISWLNFYTLLIFITLTYLCFIKAQTCLAFRQDKDCLDSEDHLMVNSFILLLSFVAIENNIKQLFISIVPDTDTGIWSWCLSLAVTYFFILIARKKSTPFIPKITGKPFIKTLLITLISSILTIGYFYFNSNSLIILKQDIAQIIGTFSILSIIKPLWSFITFFLFVTFMVAVIRRIEENFFTKNCNLACNILGILLAVLLMTKNLMLPTFIFALTMQLLKGKEKQQSIVFYSSLLYFSILSAYLIFM